MPKQSGHFLPALVACTLAVLCTQPAAATQTFWSASTGRTPSPHQSASLAPGPTGAYVYFPCRGSMRHGQCYCGAPVNGSSNAGAVTVSCTGYWPSHDHHQQPPVPPQPRPVRPYTSPTAQPDRGNVPRAERR